MSSANSFENIAVKIAALNKSEVIRRIKNFKGRFKLDFTEDYLASLSVDRLRHILLSAIMTKCRNTANK